MSNLTRKDFLRLSSWAVVATLLPIGKLNAISSISSADYLPTKEDFKKAQELAKQAKVFFYQKNYQQAEALYLECIKLAPRAIQFYDGLDNVYGAKSELLSSVELYKNGLLKNPTVLAFYDRSARSLTRLELGNQKQANPYKGKIRSTSLLKDAEKLLNKAIAVGGSKKYLVASLNKVKKKTELYAVRDTKTKVTLKKETKKTNKIQFKKSFKLKTQDQIIALLNKVDTKKRVTLYNAKEIEHQKRQIIKQKKRYTRLLVSKTNPESSKRTELIEQIFNLDPSDTLSIKVLKKEYYKNNRYADFITSKERFADKKKTVFSYLGVMDAIEQAYIKNQVSINELQKAATIGNDLFNNWSLLENARVDVANKLSKIYLLQNRYAEARLILEQTIQTTTTSTPSVVNKLIFSYANVFFAEQNYQQATSVVLAAINETELEDQTFKNINSLAKNKSRESFKDQLMLYYLLHKTYKASNLNDQADEILEKIRYNNPQDKFVLTRK